jgi:hypothetical protein
MTSSQDFEKIYPVFAVCTMKGCKKFVADMGAIAVFSFVTGVGIIYIDV